MFCIERIVDKLLIKITIFKYLRLVFLSDLLFAFSVLKKLRIRKTLVPRFTLTLNSKISQQIRTVWSCNYLSVYRIESHDVSLLVSCFSLFYYTLTCLPFCRLDFQSDISVVVSLRLFILVLRKYCFSVVISCTWSLIRCFGRDMFRERALSLGIAIFCFERFFFFQINLLSLVVSGF